MATIYNTATTLDGYLATTEHSLDWLFEVPTADEAEAAMPEFLAGVGALVMGSSTYQWVVDHEQLLEHPSTGRPGTPTVRPGSSRTVSWPSCPVPTSVSPRRRSKRCTPRPAEPPATKTSG
ncbi:hypothetical protein ACHMWU_09550 [Aeromicrobium sp. UC242_57]